MPTQKKIEQVTRIKAAVAKSGAVYLADLSGLAATQMSDLRRRLKKEQVRLMVVKNRLATRALIDAGIPADLAAIMRGPTSLVLGVGNEPYVPARLLKEVGQRYKKEWKFKGAYVEQALFSAEQFNILASMPTKPELQSQLVGLLTSPLNQLVAVLDGIISGFVLVLDELESKRTEVPAQPDAGGPTAEEKA